MFKAIRIVILLVLLLFVAGNTWLSRVHSTDWDHSLRVKIYPINADGSETTANYIAGLRFENFADIEAFAEREAQRYGHTIDRPVRIELGQPVLEQPPAIGRDPGIWNVMAWSLRMRWWVGSVTDGQDRIEPDVSIFVRYHEAESNLRLEDSVGLQKGMFGIVNGYSGRRYSGPNNVIIAHELFHTLGATDKYELGSGQPFADTGLGEPHRKPLYPQRYAEIMGGRIALAADDAIIPKSLKYAVIGPLTAEETGLRR